jgi:hypothetical protein
MPKKRTGTERQRIAPTPMDRRTKSVALQRLLDQAADIPVRRSDDPVFKAWKNTVERTLVRIYGQPSPEVEHFHELRFFYNPIMWMAGDDFTHEHRQCFDRDLQILLSSIKSYVEELPDEPADENAPATAPCPLPKLQYGRLGCSSVTPRPMLQSLKSSSNFSKSSVSLTNKSSAPHLQATT